MNLILELPQELEDELVAEASQLQLPLSEYALRLLSAGRTAHQKPLNGAQLIAYWQQAGLIGSRDDIADSAAHARTMRQQAEQRDRS